MALKSTKKAKYSFAKKNSKNQRKSFFQETSKTYELFNIFYLFKIMTPKSFVKKSNSYISIFDF